MKVNDSKAGAEGGWCCDCSMVHITTQTNINTTRGSLLLMLAFLFLLLLEREKLVSEREKVGERGVQRKGDRGREREGEEAFATSVFK